ncbi:NERD domain-containing protein [Mesorhizobium sp. MSK_1335]|uniref:NERD domain-containing protein n=1 Tax=Mesorhizobium montanum TaxID=3072323 RepID=A0ABU4ZNP0_9HYPH|nr:NERD domain-containing protein [Mesorhizobium sp. MSK_1335]MDX8526998.1 NERD domain-containing protein [Mesorhizobium sp. MSK_1335]
MAVLIPDVPKDCPNGERLVYEKLGRELPADWVVLHSLGLPRHETKIWGEADIVVLSSQGVYSLEVKGGTVSCSDGVWLFAGPGFKSYTKREDPWTQSKSALMAVRKSLCDANSAFKEVVFGFGVVMPFTRFDVAGTEFLPEVLLDKRSYREGMDQYIERLHRFWEADYASREGKTRRGLTPHQIRQARQILRPDLETALSIGGYLTGVESKIIQLTNEQIRVSRRLTANPRSVVRGAAGTGKSVLAMDRAKHLAGSGRRVLFLCFNRLLASHVRRSVAQEGISGLDVWHAHGLYREIIRRGGKEAELAALDESHPEFFARRFPEVAADALLSNGGEPWDVLIIDETQDLLTTSHFDVFDLLVVGGLNHGTWHLFLDPLQNIYGSDAEHAVETRLATAYPVLDELEDNCRNTRQVAAQASIISGIDLAMNNAPDGLECENVFYGSRPDALQKIQDLVEKLLSSDVRLCDLVILSTRQRSNSLIAGLERLAGRPVCDLGNEEEYADGAVAFSTMHAFKGLERMVVVAIDMQDIGASQWAMLHYAGLSRARCLLHAFVPNGSTHRYRRQATAFGERARIRSK